VQKKPRNQKKQQQQDKTKAVYKAKVKDEAKPAETQATPAEPVEEKPQKEASVEAEATHDD